MGEKKNKKILWVEDDYYHLRGLTRPLTNEGYEIIAAESFDQAVVELNKHKEDLCLILLDLIIPRSLTNATEPKETEEEFWNRIEKPQDLVEYGIGLFNYVKQELKLSIPIIVLSIVRQGDIIKGLEDEGAKRISKFGLLPNKLKELVLEELSQ